MIKENNEKFDNTTDDLNSLFVDGNIHRIYTSQIQLSMHENVMPHNYNIIYNSNNQTNKNDIRKHKITN
ncbi:MAG: hypothetical protein Q8899_02000 [Weeping tea tree witches'-broom phytoplasma]|uniref:hypothetical protein n=1 Tax=Candidatus Phytoplasma melaleucae TaxID=2982630 RepID=UPI00293A4E45|nr:hypothetical protein [Weeping tea tree witches'-broom phytoplasma]